MQIKCVNLCKIPLKNTGNLWRLFLGIWVSLDSIGFCYTNWASDHDDKCLTSRYYAFVGFY